MVSSLNVADLFCGAGGLSLGFKMAGFQIKFGLDVDWDAIFTFKENIKEVSWINKDIRKVSVNEIKNVSGTQNGDFDIIIAGIPCEGYSLLNRRYDPSDPRNFLFLEFIRVVKELKPRMILIENVTGLTRRANGGFKDAIKKSLEELGFIVNFFELNSINYGIPQKRRRVFFIGNLNEKFYPPPPTHDINQINLDQYFTKSKPNKLKPKLTVEDAISDLPPLNPNEEKHEYEVEPKTKYQKELRDKNYTLYNHKAPNHPEWTIRRIAETQPGKPIYDNFKQRIRLKWQDPSPTVVAGGVRPQWFFGHPEQPRGITVREMARLQSYPDSYRFYGSLIKQRILVGDSVPPLLPKALANEIKLYLN